MTTDTLDRLSGVVAVCPALRLAEDVEDPILDQFIQLWPMDSLKKVFPKFPATPGTQGTIFSEVPELRQAAQASIEADPLEYSGMVKMATGLTFLQSLLIEKTRKKLVAKIQTLKKPLLILVRPPFPSLSLSLSLALLSVFDSDCSLHFVLTDEIRFDFLRVVLVSARDE
mmetsp:Transcript_10064/g.25094  ORF Transcript_10064/g.25094 Transcript_10064/m.25094 type:complete len:170 (+) Transcript_10064:376-885(+)